MSGIQTIVSSGLNQKNMEDSKKPKKVTFFDAFAQKVGPVEGESKSDNSPKAKKESIIFQRFALGLQSPQQPVETTSKQQEEQAQSHVFNSDEFGGNPLSPKFELQQEENCYGMESPSFSYGKVPSYGYVDDDRECEKDDSNEEEVYGKLEDDDKQKEVEFKNPRSKFVDSIYVEDLWFAAKFWSEHEEQIVKTKKRSELKQLFEDTKQHWSLKLGVKPIHFGWDEPQFHRVLYALCFGMQRGRLIKNDTLFWYPSKYNKQKPQQIKQPHQQMQGPPMDFNQMQGPPMDFNQMQGPPMGYQHQMPPPSMEQQYQMQGPPMDFNQMQGPPMDFNQMQGPPMDFNQMQGPPMGYQYQMPPPMEQQYQMQGLPMDYGYVQQHPRRYEREAPHLLRLNKNQP